MSFLQTSGWVSNCKPYRTEQVLVNICLEAI